MQESSTYEESTGTVAIDGQSQGQRNEPRSPIPLAGITEVTPSLHPHEPLTASPTLDPAASESLRVCVITQGTFVCYLPLRMQ